MAESGSQQQQPDDDTPDDHAPHPQHGPCVVHTTEPDDPPRLTRYEQRRQQRKDK